MAGPIGLTHKKGLPMAEDAYSLFARAIGFLNEKHPAQAAVLLERAKACHPDKGSIREALGRAYYNYGQYELALSEFEQAITIDPTNHYAHFGLSLCLRKTGEVARAIGHIKMALAMHPEEMYRRTLAEMAEQ